MKSTENLKLHNLSPEQTYLERHIFYGLHNLNNGFDALSIWYFSEQDFETVLHREAKNGLGIFGIEPFKGGEFYDVLISEDFSKTPDDPNWYLKAFEALKKMNEPLQYAASYFIPEHVLHEFSNKS